jgi:plasmid stabilization system protein ParE
MMRRLIIFPRAEQDAQRIFDWLAARSPQGADNWFIALEDAIKRLLDNPTVYALAPEDEAVHCDLRQFLFRTRHGNIYRGLFTIVGNEIRVLRLRGPGQPPLAQDEIGI